MKTKLVCIAIALFFSLMIFSIWNNAGKYAYVEFRNDNGFMQRTSFYAKKTSSFDVRMSNDSTHYILYIGGHAVGGGEIVTVNGAEFKIN